MIPVQEPEELELVELVRRAQSFDQAAIDELYKRFRGMILNLTNTTNVQLALGEDAENIAWEYFYNFIQKPELSHRKNIAGYIKKCINLKLTTRINAEIRPWTVDSIDEYEANSYQIAEENNKLENFLQDSILKETFSKLSKDSRTVLKKFYFDGYSLEDCAKIIGRSYLATYKLKQKALSKLRKTIPVCDYSQN